MSEAQGTATANVLSVTEAAAALGCSPGLVYKLCDQGRIGFHRIGFKRGKITISPEQLEAYRRSCEVIPAGGDAPPEKGKRRARAAGIPDVLGEFRSKKRAR